MTAQFLYDLRTLTGFISGSDLHSLFELLGVGPSPKGRVEIDITAAQHLCPELKAEMYSPDWGEHARQYAGIYCGNAPLFMFNPAEAEERVAHLVAEAESAAFDEVDNPRPKRNRQQVWNDSAGEFVSTLLP